MLSLTLLPISLSSSGLPSELRLSRIQAGKTGRRTLPAGKRVCYFLISILGTMTQRLNRPIKAAPARMASIVTFSCDLVYASILADNCYREIS